MVLAEPVSTLVHLCLMSGSYEFTLSASPVYAQYKFHLLSVWFLLLFEFDPTLLFLWYYFEQT